MCIDNRDDDRSLQSDNKYKNNGFLGNRSHEIPLNQDFIRVYRRRTSPGSPERKDYRKKRTVLLLFDPVLQRSHKVPPVGTPGFFKGGLLEDLEVQGPNLELP